VSRYLALTKNDAAVQTAYEGRQISWFKVYAGDEACETIAAHTYPQDTLQAIKNTVWRSRATNHTSRGGIRSLNVALRQINDLYTCVRPAAITQELHRLTKPEKLDVSSIGKYGRYLPGIEWRQGSEIGDRNSSAQQRTYPRSRNMALSVSP